jgi:hypothetical protein
VQVTVVTNHNRQRCVLKPVDLIFGFRILSLLSILAVTLTVAGCQTAESIDGAIVGDSMSPNLMGTHCQAHCEDCQISFSFGRPPDDQPRAKLVCPNCGFADNRFADSTEQSAESVKILPAQPILRWSQVAFEFSETNQAGIKRVVGLPGETIEIRLGDLFVEDKILRKDFPTQKQLRIPIHDSQFQPTTDIPSRWRLSVDDPNWLVYHHWRCCAHRGLRDEDFAVDDNYGFNQTLARNLHQTDDLFLEIEIALAPDHVFGWRFYRGSTSYEFWISPNPRHLSIEIKNPQTSERDCQQVELLPFHADQVRIEFSSFDAQAIVAINDQHVFQKTCEPSRSPPNKYPLEISPTASKTAIHRIQLWRDIFYYAESVSGSRLNAGPDGYILLGDNVPVSIDSRHWQPAAINTAAIIGTIRKLENQDNRLNSRP